MARGYEDWRSMTFLQDQAAGLYYADVFRSLDTAPIVTVKKIIETGKTFYCYGTMTVKAEGGVFVYGGLNILGG